LKRIEVLGDIATTLTVKLTARQFLQELRVSGRGHEEVELDHGKEFNFQDVHFFGRDAADLGVEGIVVVSIIVELGSGQDRGEDQAVDVQRGDLEGRTIVEDAIDVNQGEGQGFTAGFAVLGNTAKRKKWVKYPKNNKRNDNRSSVPLEIVLDTDGRSTFRIENSDQRRIRGELEGRKREKEGTTGKGMNNNCEEATERKRTNLVIAL
jgi:hypothetical protein